MKCKAILLVSVIGTLVVLSGCTKNVEDITTSVTVSGSSVVGVYTGEMESDQANGKGLFRGNDSFTADGVFENGELTSGTVNDLPTSMVINGESVDGIYSGAYAGGASGKGSFTFKRGSAEIAFEGEFKNHQLTSGEVTEYPLDVEITGINYSGTYTGEISNNDITGKGTFKSKGVEYIGGFEKGKLSGDGEFRNSTYVVHFTDLDRKGKYDGNAKDGIAEGEGEFSAKTDDGVKYTYKGAWKSGLYNGHGKLVYNSKDFYKETGNFKDGEFKPTVLEAFESIGTGNKSTFSVSKNAAKYIEKNDKLFSGKASKSSVKKAKKKAKSLPSFNTLKNNVGKYGKKLYKVTINPFQVKKEKFWQYSKGRACLLNYGGWTDVLYINFLKPPKSLKEDKTTTVYVVPVDYSTYETVNNKSIWCIRAVGIAY